MDTEDLKTFVKALRGRIRPTQLGIEEGVLESIADAVEKVIWKREEEGLWCTIHHRYIEECNRQRPRAHPPCDIKP